MKKDLLNIYDLETADFDKILKKAAKLKKSLKEGKPHASLKGKTLGMIFDNLPPGRESPLKSACIS